MWFTRPAAVALLVMMTGLPAMAQDIEIATLGHAPVMPPSGDSTELKRNFDANQAMMAQAGRKLGLTAGEFGQFKLAVEQGNASYGPVPRHLDKMTWAADGVVHTIAGVHIPARQMGFRVLVPKHDGSGNYIVYLPGKCGNLSYVFQPEHRIAEKPAFPQPHPLVASAQSFPAPQVPLVAATGVSGTTPAVSPIPPPPIPPIHHLNLLPLAAVVPFLFHGGSNVIPPPSGGTVVGPPPCP